MKKLIIFIGISIFVFGCKSSKVGTLGSGKMLNYGSPKVKQTLLDDQTFLIKEYITDETYGYTQENPIMVGSEGSGPLNQRRFLNALAGSNGETLSYTRLGSCCMFYTKNGLFGDSGMLDMYEVTYSGLKKPKILYINMYDSDVLKVPVGFILKE